MIDRKIQHLFMSFIVNENLYQLLTSLVYLKNVLMLAEYYLFIYLKDKRMMQWINESIIEQSIGPYESKFNATYNL